MTISIGQKIPSVVLKRLGNNGMEEVDFASYLSGKKAIIFAVPGAFTPSCHEKHLPGYIQKADELKAQGVDEIICISVNDPFVMKAWGEASGAVPAITMMPDGNGTLTKALGLEFDGSGAGLSIRSKRYVMVVENGVVQSLNIEAAPSDVELSAAEMCLIDLKAAA